LPPVDLLSGDRLEGERGLAHAAEEAGEGATLETLVRTSLRRLSR
jgi:hypothetical protein